MRQRAPGQTGRQRPAAILAALAVLLSVITVTGTILTSPAHAQARTGETSRTTAADTATAGTQDSTATVTARLRAVAAAAAARIYTVHAGQTLTSIARDRCGHAGMWTGIYAASRAAGQTAANANVLTIGQHLTIVCAYDPAQLHAAAAPRATRTRSHLAAGRRSGGKIWGVTYGFPNFCGDGDGDGYDISCSQLHRGTTTGASSRSGTVRRSYTAAAGSYGNVSASSYSGFQRCVIERESGGNSQVMNSSGHYGLYQFSASTWQAYGGSAATFGHASVAEQNRIFANAMARGGESNWSPYDGC